MEVAVSTRRVSSSFLNRCIAASNQRMMDIQLVDNDGSNIELRTIDIVSNGKSRLSIARIVIEDGKEFEYILIKNSHSFDPHQIIALRMILGVHRDVPVAQMRHPDGGIVFLFNAVQQSTSWSNKEGDA